MLTLSRLVLICLLLPACGSDPDNGINLLIGPDALLGAADTGPADDGGVEVDMGLAESEVGVSIRVLNPGVRGGYPGVTLSGPFGESLTNSAGTASLAVAAGEPYQIAMQIEGARVHRLHGVAGMSSFEQVTYLSPDMVTSLVFQSLSLSVDDGRGILVVGLDLPSLAAAVGASASIDLESDTPFVFAGQFPQSGHVIPTGGQGFVTFPNVEPGQVVIQTSFPTGQCRVFPAETETPVVSIQPGEVTVIAFTCRTD